MLDFLRQTLDSELTAGRRWCVALSGGMDSTVLLHALAGLCREYPGNTIRALHINHGLHPDADAWAENCRQQCARLDVALVIRAVTVSGSAEIGLEAAAREARYRVFREELCADEWLLTAHHRDDQVETLLLRLLRGSGPHGLGSIEPVRKFAGGWLARPLLDIDRTALEAYARAQGLTWVDDPANTDTAYDRNFLRHRVLPLLQERWPGLGETLPRAARLSGEAAGMLDELAALDTGDSLAGDSLALSALADLSLPRQRNLLRYWLACNDVLPPPESRLQEGLRQLLTAAQDRSPALEWGSVQIRRYRERLYLLKYDPRSVAGAADERRTWDGRGRIDLGPLRGSLRFTAGNRDLDIPAEWTIRFRLGGERVAGEAGRKSVKKLFQEHGVVPWMRAHVPLLFHGERLSAVGNLWQDDDLGEGLAEGPVIVAWENHPSVF